MKLAAHILQPFNSQALSYLASLLEPGIQISQGPEIQAAPDFQILVAGRPNHDQISASPNLRALVVPFAGLPASTRALMQNFPHVAVHNLHYNAVPTAEMAVSLLLAAAKRIVPMDRSLRAHDWTPRYERVPSVLMANKTALILGYGAIGRRVASICRALDMNAIAIRRTASDDDSPIPVYGPVDLHFLLPKADALIICLPHTSATDGLITHHELDLLPSGAIVVNIARGAIAEEAALYEALRSRRLHAAGLDAWYNYPEDATARTSTPPSRYPFHELDNVVMSPHRASAVVERDNLRASHLAQLLNAAARGEPIPNRVDLEAGY